MDTNATLQHGIKGYSYTKLIVIVAMFFFIFGFITWINGALIPYLRLACQLTEFQAYFVTFAFYISYTVMAIPSGKLIKHFGMLSCMQYGLYIMALGCLVFLPAAIYREYLVFLCGLFIIGIGLTLLQTAINPFITLFGPAHKAAQRISIMSACNKFAGLLAPLLFGKFILMHNSGFVTEMSSISPTRLNLELDYLAHMVIVPYAILALFLVLIGSLVKRSALSRLKPEENVSPEIPVGDYQHKKYLLQIITGFIAIFCCVGAEVVAGDTIANYGIYQGIEWGQSALLTSLTLFAMFLGCITGAVLMPKYVSQECAFVCASIFGMFVITMILFLQGHSSVFAVAALGFANAFLWPAIWPQALRDLRGNQLNTASSLLIMGIAGGAIMPLVYGKLAQILDNHCAYVALLPCYLYLVWYWWLGRQTKISV